ncbi:MAG: hypothetical protein AAF555_02200 [Verrucomicrobiota bacterium]
MSFLDQILSQLGFSGPRKRLALRANQEQELLVEAEQLLGKMAWEDIEPIEALSTDYWKIKDLRQQRVKLDELIEQSHADIAEKEDQRAEVAEELERQIRRKNEEKQKVLPKLDENILDQEDLKIEAEGIKNRFDGLKVKLRVLKNEGQTEAELEPVRADMTKIRDQYNGLKTQLNTKKEEFDRHSIDLEKKEDALSELKNQLRTRMRELTGALGKKSKALAEQTSHRDSLEREEGNLYQNIGRFLTRHPDDSQATQEVVKKHQSAIQKVRALRHSALHHQTLARL